MDWLRWHHGTVNDPKWRVIARKSGQPISLVLSVFASFLERASSSEDRGSIIGWSAEDIATCFDVDDADIISIHQAMQGRVLDGDRLSGWRRGRSPFPAKAYDIYLPKWIALRKAVFIRDDFTCAYCGQRGGRLECDHVMPASRGGSNDIGNLTTACFKCNRSKRDKTLAEWRAS